MVVVDFYFFFTLNHFNLTPKRGVIMDFILAGMIGAAVLGYLTYVLFNPEKF